MLTLFDILPLDLKTDAEIRIKKKKNWQLKRIIKKQYCPNLNIHHCINLLYFYEGYLAKLELQDRTLTIQL